jgi:hypothetical protein
VISTFSGIPCRRVGLNSSIISWARGGQYGIDCLGEGFTGPRRQTDDIVRFMEAEKATDRYAS